MRLVRFEDESGEFAVELHPLLTVISGLDERAREGLIRTISAIPRGADPHARGSIEVHGIYLDLNRETLDLLELHQDVDVVVRSSDLPGADEPLAGRGPEAPSPVYEVSHAVSHDVPSPPAVDVEAARTRAAEIDAAQQELSAAIGQLRSQLVTLAQERHGLGQQVESSRASLDSFAVAALKVARDELADLEARLDAAQDDPSAIERADIEARLEVLIAEADELKREAKRLGAIDTSVVRDAFQRLDAALTVPETVPSPEAQDLIARWSDLAARSQEHDQASVGSRDVQASLVARRDEARERVTAAERSLRSPALDPGLVESLEETHDEIFELDGKASKLGGSKIRRRQEELRQREDELLAKLGFDTWSSYVMGLPNAAALAQRQAELEAHRAELDEADAALAAAPTEPEHDQLRDELETSRLALLDEAIRLLGEDPGPDPVEALAALRVEVDDVERPDPDDAAIALCTALEHTGTQIDPEALDIAEVHSVASGWLEAMAELPERVAAIDEQRLQLEAEIDAEAARLDALAPATPPGAEQAERDDVLARVASAEERVQLHEAAAARLADLSHEQEQLNSTERDLQFSIGERERQLAEYAEAHRVALDVVRSAEEAAQVREAPVEQMPDVMDTAPLASMAALSGTRRAAGVDALEWYILARLAQQRAISFAGSVPILIDDAFNQWSFDELDDVFARLERMSEVIQVVYLTDDPDVANWGRNLGRSRAQVLDLRSIVA